jgi:NAD(P)H dehydrogenase (quinone)
MSIVITGASGKLGRLTAEAVARNVSPSEVTLVTRTPDALGNLAERGFVVRAGDFEEPASLQAAFAGAEKVLLISIEPIGDRVRRHRAAIDAAVAAGARSIAYTSMGNPSDSNPAIAAHEHRQTEEAVRASGVGWTFLRNSIYSDMLVMRAGGPLGSGKLVTNAGDGRTSYVARADCAAAAAAVLTSDGHDGKEYDITGPEALDTRDVAALYEEFGGRPVEPVFIDDEAWVAGAVENAGMPEAYAKIVVTFGAAARLNYSAVVSPAVAELTGRQPATVREVFEAHRDELVGSPS